MARQHLTLMIATWVAYAALAVQACSGPLPAPPPTSKLAEADVVRTGGEDAADGTVDGAPDGATDSPTAPADPVTEPISCKVGEAAPSVTCRDEVANAALASKERICNSKGDGFIAGPCTIQGCSAGFILKGATCEPESCSPGATGVVSCKDDIEFSIAASKATTCKADGNGFDFGPCQLESCENGNDKVGNACVAQECKPGDSYGDVDCAADIPGASTAGKAKTCNAEAKFVYDICRVSVCQDTHIKNGNACTPKTCDANMPAGTVNCTADAPNAMTATKARTCNASGTDYLFGTCTVSACLSGYNLQTNSCVVNSCTPSEVLGVDCTGMIANSQSASRLRRCNAAGSNFTYDSCLVSQCNNGYVAVNNACVQSTCTPGATDTISCAASIADAATANRGRTCNTTGTGYDLSASCTLATCRTGFHKVGNACVVNECTPNESVFVDCAAMINNAATATRSRTCSASGDAFSYGTCNLSTCRANYYATASNTCAAQLCAPSSIDTIGCVNEIPNAAAATKTRTCLANGSGYSAPGACTLTSCQAGYTKSGNSCVLTQVCTPGQLMLASCANEITNAATAQKEKVCMANGQWPAAYGACYVTSCVNGSHQVGTNQCVTNTCNPNQFYGNETCSTGGTGVGSATREKSCNANGSAFTYGTCTVQSCASGWVQEGNACIASASLEIYHDGWTGPNVYTSNVGSSAANGVVNCGPNGNYNDCVGEVPRGRTFRLWTPATVTYAGGTFLQQFTWCDFGNSVGLVHYCGSAMRQSGNLLYVDIEVPTTRAYMRCSFNYGATNYFCATP